MAETESEDEEDAQHLAALGSLIFLPGFACMLLASLLSCPASKSSSCLSSYAKMCLRLKQWALSTMGFTSAQVFGAWKQFVHVYGGTQLRVGAFLPCLRNERVYPCA
jgi:hypothetical protein